jgi:hypothetical protein
MQTFVGKAARAADYVPTELACPLWRVRTHAEPEGQPEGQVPDAAQLQV